MGSLAIEALKGDWERHALAASAGDARSLHAAAEVLARLEELGAAAEWIDEARSRGPQNNLSSYKSQERPHERDER